MCLNPIKLYNPKNQISLSGGHLFEIQIPCGECPECQKIKKEEWYFRAYYEAKSTWDAGGYVYFDTLTYDNEHLPHINDYLDDKQKVSNMLNVSCFNVEHYRFFMMRLRRQLEYAGYDIRGNLKYFLTSEYGTDERFTHRPHYHVLFFVKLDIDPLQFSKFVNNAWQMGRTDGIDWHPATYVYNHVFSPKYNADTVHLQSVCNYVAKYVTKDNDFAKTVESRLNVVFDRLYGKDWRDDDATERLQDKYKALRKQMFQFHRQSHGFGEDFLKYNDIDEVLKTGMISMPDKNNIVKHIPLPSYYSHKIFYDLVKDMSGHALRWELNELGKSYKISRAVKCIELLKDKFGDWLRNMKDYNYYHDMADKKWYDDIISKFESLNNDRDLAIFAMYLTFYKGRVKSKAQRDRESNGIYVVDDPIEFLAGSMDQLTQFGESIYFYGNKTTRRIFGQKFVSNKFLGNAPEWHENGLPNYIANWSTYKSDIQMFKGYTPNFVKRYSNRGERSFFGAISTPQEFCKSYVINDTADERFAHYDEMWSLYCQAQLDKSEWKEKAHNSKVALQKRLKSAGIYVSNI